MEHTGIARITHEEFVRLLEEGIAEHQEQTGTYHRMDVHYIGGHPLESYGQFAHGHEGLEHYRAGHVVGAHCPRRRSTFVACATQRMLRFDNASVWSSTQVHHDSSPDKIAEVARSVPYASEIGLPFV